MAWLSRVNFIASDTLSFTDVNNLGNDIRAWGGNVNGGGYTLSNVVVSASAGTMATVTGGSAAGSTLTLRSTSGAGTTDAIIFQTGAQVEQARITTSGNVGIGATNPAAQLQIHGTGQNTAAITDAGSQSATVAVYSLNGTTGAGGAIALGGIAANGIRTQTAIKNVLISTTANGTADLAFSARVNTGDTALTEHMRIVSGGNVCIGGNATRATTEGSKVLHIFDGTAPVGTLANGCSFYSTAGEMRVMDAAGNATLLSPHDQTTNEWIYDSAHTPTGKRLKINVEKLLRFVNDHFGLDCISEFTEVAQ
jgi:hypothetical protein